MARSRMFKPWLERVQAPEMSHGHINQFKNRVWPQGAYGVINGGHALNMTDGEAADIVQAFDSRVRIDGGPRVTEAQADIGREYLARYAKRLGIRTDVDYRKIDHFRFEDVYVVDDNRWRVVTAPVYRAFWPDGLELVYWAAPWTAGTGRNDESQFRFFERSNA